MTTHLDALEALPARPTVRQAAEHMQVTTKTIHRWISEGRVKAFRVGPRMVRVDRESLLKLAEKPLTQRLPARNRKTQP